MSTETASPAKAANLFSVLIVDDNRDFVDFVSLLLTHNGFSVHKAFNGPEGLDALRREAIDLVILDVMMPQMDGLAVCREIKQIKPNLPVILLTAKDDVATRTAAMNLGVCEFLAKPVNIEDFVSRVRTQRDVIDWDKRLDAALAADPQKTADVAKRG